MSSSLDVYAPCPCGSGKKLKFCCQNIIGDMDKVRRQIEAKQHRNAMQSLTALEAKAPTNAWLLSTKAQLQMMEGELAPARATLERLMAAHPESSVGAVLYALVCYQMDGYEASLPAIQRALPRAAAAPDFAAILVQNISAQQLGRGRYVSARQYFALLLRWASAEERNEVLTRLLELEAEPGAPYPLRGAHYLSTWTGGGEDENRTYAKATRLAVLGSWDAAAIHFTNLAEAHPEAAPLWHNAALCRAFVGDEAAAATAFHRAAATTSDGEGAIELETLAQLFDHATAPDPVFLRAKTFTTSSVSRLLTRMSESARLCRDHAVEEDSTDEAGRPLAARFDILDRPLPPPEELAGMTNETAPVRLGDVLVFDGVPEKEIPPRVELQSSDLDFEAAETALVESSGPELQMIGRSQAAGGGFSRELALLDRRLWLPQEGLSIADRRRLVAERWNWLVHEEWAGSPQRALGGRTPRQAATDPTQLRAVRASINVMDAWSQQRGHSLDTGELCRRLGVAPPEPLRLSPDAEATKLSALQLVRIVPESLSTEQLMGSVNRGLLLGHRRLGRALLLEVVSRSDLHGQINLDQILDQLVRITATLGLREEALRHVERALDNARRLPNAFERLLHWELAELTIRSDDPDDPAIPPLVRRLVQYYGRKVPQLMPTIERVCAMAGVDVSTIPMEPAGSSPLAGAGSTSSGGVWTPGGGAGGAPKKLWLPGGE